MNEPPDDLARMLAPPPASPDPDRRAATLAATANVHRRGRAIRRIALVAGVVLVFAAGGVAGWVVKPTPVPTVVERSPEPVSQLLPPSPDTEPLSAERVELKAELADDSADAARLYREAGDRFLADRDYENAARCYRRHLAVTDADGRKVSTSDSWMLSTMKVPTR